MRCARCDRLAIPQAVGHSAKGMVIFGWCVRCLEETGCQQITVAARVKRPSTRVELERAPRAVPSRMIPPSVVPRVARTTPDERRRLVGGVALIIALWGLALLLVGLVFRTLELPRTPNPLGNGTPALLIGGGGSTAVIGLTLWLLSSGLDVARSRPTLKVIQVVTFLIAMATLLAGVATHSPKRDPLVVGVASVSLALSVAARWLETRLILVRPRR